MKATNEAIAEKEKLLQWISETDEFNPIGLIPSGPPSQFRNVAWNVINNVDPTSANATADLDKFIREAGWINQYGMKNFRFGLQSFWMCCDSVKFRREMWLSAALNALNQIDSPRKSVRCDGNANRASI